MFILRFFFLSLSNCQSHFYYLYILVTVFSGLTWHMFELNKVTFEVGLSAEHLNSHRKDWKKIIKEKRLLRRVKWPKNTKMMATTGSNSCFWICPGDGKLEHVTVKWAGHNMVTISLWKLYSFPFLLRLTQNVFI